MFFDRYHFVPVKFCLIRCKLAVVIVKCEISFRVRTLHGFRGHDIGGHQLLVSQITSAISGGRRQSLASYRPLRRRPQTDVQRSATTRGKLQNEHD